MDWQKGPCGHLNSLSLSLRVPRKRDSLSFFSSTGLPHYTTTGLSPAELLMGRRLRTHLDLLHPDTASRMTKKIEKNISGKVPRKFSTGDKVYVTQH